MLPGRDRSDSSFGSRLIVVAFRLVAQILFVAPMGTTVLLELPGITLPSWLAGIRLGGTLMLEPALHALYEGLRLAAIIVAVGAASSLASPHRLLKSIPAAVYEVGVSVVVATTFLPQLASDVSSHPCQPTTARTHGLRSARNRWNRHARPARSHGSIDRTCGGYGLSWVRADQRPSAVRGLD